MSKKMTNSTGMTDCVLSLFSLPSIRGLTDTLSSVLRDMANKMLTCYSKKEELKIMYFFNSHAAVFTELILLWEPVSLMFQHLTMATEYI